MPDIHPRKLIRAAVVAILVGTAPNYATVAADRVKAARIPPFRVKKDLPAIAIYTPDEQIVPDSHDTVPKNTERHVQLVVDAYLDLELIPGSIDTAALDDAFDDIALQIERAIEKAETANNALNGEAAWCRLDGTHTFISELGEKPCGCLRMTFDVMYYGRDIEPEFGRVDLVDTHYSLAGAQTDVRDQADDTQEFGT